MVQPSEPIDTIVAIATPFGEGGLGVVRVSGPNALAFTSHFFRSAAPLTSVPANTLHHGWVWDGQEPVDEAVAAVFRTPASYTGDDVVELSCHGSPAVLRLIVDLCLRHGARMAKPGEFTERAFLNGKMDLTRAEAVADLIHSRSDKARRMAAGQLKGRLQAKIAAIRAPLVNVLAQLEANLDFVEEDIPPMSRSAARDQLTETIRSLDALLATSLQGRWLRDGLKIAIVGRPNVGKSSLFNALLDRDRAIVTAVPGTTRDTLEESADWNGCPVVLIDTAGLRETRDPVEQMGHERAERSRAQSNLQFLVLDGSSPVEKDDLMLVSQCRPETSFLVVNKSDRPAAWVSKDVREFKPFQHFVTSAVTGAGLKELKAVTVSCLASASLDAGETDVAINDRHARLLEVARAKLDRARAALEASSEESVAWDLKDAVRSLDAVLGTDVDTDVLDAIFRSFCIGK